MTEAEWLECGEPETLVEFLRSRTTDRKCRLVAVALCRHVLPLVRDQCGLLAVEVSEQFADGRSGLEEMLAISERVGDAYVSMPNPVPVNTEPPVSFKAESAALQSTMFLTGDSDDYLAACCRCTYLAALRWAFLRAGPGNTVYAPNPVIQWQIQVIKEVIGNPFRPVAFDPDWRTSTVVALAAGIYDEKAFERLPLLADALEAAGARTTTS